MTAEQEQGACEVTCRCDHNFCPVHGAKRPYPIYEGAIRVGTMFARNKQRAEELARDRFNDRQVTVG